MANIYARHTIDKDTKNKMLRMEQYLLANTTFIYTSADVQVAYRYRGDLNGLLKTLGIDKRYYALVAKMNNIKASYLYDGTLSTFKVPDEIYTEKILK